MGQSLTSSVPVAQPATLPGRVTVTQWVAGPPVSQWRTTQEEGLRDAGPKAVPCAQRRGLSLPLVAMYWAQLGQPAGLPPCDPVQLAPGITAAGPGQVTAWIWPGASP